MNRSKFAKIVEMLAISIVTMYVSFATAQTVEPRYIYITFNQSYPTVEAVKVAAMAAALRYVPPGTTYGAVVSEASVNPPPHMTLNGRLTDFFLEYFPPPNSGYPNGYLDVIILRGECPLGYYGEMAGGAYTNYVYTQVCVKPKPCDCEEGNPIQISSGVKVQREIDYQGPGGLQFTREYRGDRNGWVHNFKVAGIDLGSPPDFATRDSLLSNLSCISGIGAKTGLPYCFQQVNASFGVLSGTPANDFLLQRGHGRVLEFGTSINFNPAADINDRVTKITDAGGQTSGWAVYNSGNDATEYFDVSSSRLQRIVARNGLQKTLVYSDAGTPAIIAPTAGLLVRVIDGFGRQLNFTYDSQGRMKALIEPAGGISRYAYDEASSIVLPGNSPVGNLTSVTYPDDKKRIYWYNEQDQTANTNLPYALTGITDENGVRFATFKYDVTGKAVSTEHAGGAEKFTVSYPSADRQTHVIDPLGTPRDYNFQAVLGVLKNVGVFQAAGAGSPAVSNAFTYDANGNVKTRRDFRGIVTSYNYDMSRNLEILRTEGVGQSEQRIVNTQWHPTYRLPLKTAEPKRITTFDYYPNGNLHTKTEQATTDLTGATGFSATLTGTPRTWTYTYNSVGQILTATGPRTDINDTTTYTYYDVTGDLKTVKNAAGHLTTYSNYDGNGRVQKIVDANGLTIDLTYTPRGWLSTRTVSGTDINETTSYLYDNVGQVQTITLPDSSVVTYGYDDAHRQNKITDSAGNSINYVLDAMGNIKAETIKDPNGVLAKTISRDYDALNRLKRVTGGAQ